MFWKLKHSIKGEKILPMTAKAKLNWQYGGNKFHIIWKWTQKCLRQCILTSKHDWWSNFCISLKLWRCSDIYSSKAKRLKKIHFNIVTGKGEQKYWGALEELLWQMNLCTSSAVEWVPREIRTERESAETADVHAELSQTYNERVCARSARAP